MDKNQLIKNINVLKKKIYSDNNINSKAETNNYVKQTLIDYVQQLEKNIIDNDDLDDICNLVELFIADQFDELGSLHDTPMELVSIVELLEYATTKFHSPSILILVQIYCGFCCDCVSFPRNYERAFGLCSQIIDIEPSAKHFMARLLYNGYGCKRNIDLAVKMLTEILDNKKNYDYKTIRDTTILLDAHHSDNKYHNLENNGEPRTDELPDSLGQGHLSDRKVYDRELSDKEDSDNYDRELSDRKVYDREFYDRELSDRKVYDRELSDRNVYDRELSDKEDSDDSSEEIRSEYYCDFCEKSLSRKKILEYRCNGCFNVVCKDCIKQCHLKCPRLKESGGSSETHDPHNPNMGDPLEYNEDCYMCPQCIDNDVFTCCNCENHICRCSSGAYFEAPFAKLPGKCSKCKNYLCDKCNNKNTLCKICAHDA